jgi:hypothetical protein
MTPIADLASMLMPMVTNPRTKPDGSAYTKDDKEFWELERNGGVRRHEHRAYPAMLYQAYTSDNGKVLTRDRIVATEREADAAKAEGWYAHPTDAIDAHEGSARAVARAAAEVAHAVQSMSEPARKDYKKRSAETDTHVTE